MAKVEHFFSLTLLCEIYICQKFFKKSVYQLFVYKKKVNKQTVIEEGGGVAEEKEKYYSFFFMLLLGEYSK